MKNLETESIKQSMIIPKWIIVTIILIGFIGFLDATYLTAHHYLGTPLPCSVLTGCEQVTTSSYATVFGIPLALGGSLYYLTVLLLGMLYLDTHKKLILSFFLPLTFIGFLSSAWFVYLQLFVIKAICPYCMLSALSSTILFGVSIVLVNYILKNKRI